MYQPRHHERGREHRHDRDREHRHDGRDGRHRHPQEQWEDQRLGGYRGGGYPEGAGPMQRGYGTQPMAVRQPQGYQQQQQGYPVAGYAMQPGPRYQQPAVAQWSAPQVAVSGPGYQQHGGYPTDGYQQRGYAPHAQDRPTGSGYQQPQAGHMPHTQDRPAGSGSGYQQPQQGHVEAQDRSGHQQQSEYPSQGRDEFRNPSYQTYPVDSQTGISRIQNYDLRQYNGQQDHQGITQGDVARTNGHLHGTDTRKDKRSSDGGNWFSRTSGNRRKDRHSSPGDALDDGNHPVRRRRVVSDRRQHKRKSGQVQIVNPMGMRLRRQIPDFDFAAFAEQLNDEELKEFDTRQPVIPEPDYSDEEEEEEEGEEEEEEKKDEAKEELDEERDDQERKDSEIDLQFTRDENVDTGARESVSIEKSRPKTKKKSERRQFVKETTGLMKDELVFFLSLIRACLCVVLLMCVHSTVSCVYC